MAGKFASGLPLTEEEKYPRTLDDALSQAEEAIVAKRKNPGWPYGCRGTTQHLAVDDRII